MKKFLLSLFTILTFTAAYSQSVIFTEDFNYPSAVAGDSLGGGAGTTTAVGDTIWKKHSGTATGGRCVKYSPTSLSLAGYIGSGIGGAVSMQHTVGSADVNAYIGQSINSGSVYTTFLLRVDSATGNSGVCDYSIHYADLYGAVSISNFRSRLFICAGSDSLTKFKIGLSKGTNAILTATQITAGAKAPSFATTEYNIGQTYLCILKYTFNSTSSKDDEMSLFVMNNAAIPTTEPTADVVFTDTAITDLSKIQSICLRQGSIGRTLSVIDGIRVFTTWDALTIAQILPVRLLSFNAAKNENGTANVFWSVNGDDDVVTYVVEKSTNGKEFTTLTTVKANQSNNYSVSDNSVLQVTTYYRVKFISKNGTTKYSNTVAVSPKKSVSLDIFPNPAQNNIIVSYSKLTTDAHISVNNIDGKNIMNFVAKAGTTQSSLDITSLNKGTYIVTFLDLEGNKTSKTILKN